MIEQRYLLTILVGVMMGVQVANQALTQVSKRFAEQVARRLPRMPLTKYAAYNIGKQVAKWIGIKLTKQTAARTASKVIPVLGGAVSAGVTAAMMLPMGKRLKVHFKMSKYTGSDAVIEVEPR